MDWKIDRLLNWYAWKYWFNFVNILVVLLAVVTAVLSANFSDMTGLKILMWILIPALFVFCTLDSVCGPQQLLFLEKGGVYARVYQEFTHHFCIVVKTRRSTTEIWTNEYDHLFLNSPQALLVYQSLQDKKWYLWRKNAEEKLLGERLNKVLFRLNEKEQGIIALAYNEVQTFVNEFAYVEDIYAPPMMKITDEDGIPLEMPDELLIMKNGNSYVVYGFYLESEMPYYRRVYPSVLIFRDGSERVLIQWNKAQKVYTELYRGHNMSRRLNSFFVEFDDDYKVGGRIFRYNAGTGQLQIVYEGSFRSMDFESGVIVGDDGVTYGGKDV